MSSISRARLDLACRVSISRTAGGGRYAAARWTPRLAAALVEFANEVRTWLEEHLSGEFAPYRGMGLTGQEDIPAELQIAWERELASGGWLGIDFPEWIGGRACTLSEQVVFFNTYVESRAPGRMPNLGVTLLGPTLMVFGSEDQQRRFVPKILSGEKLWCQGYSEPDAGSDLANVKTRAELVDSQWVINGQKIWTSLAQHADWAFIVARTAAGSSSPFRAELPAGTHGPTWSGDSAHRSDHRRR